MALVPRHVVRAGAEVEVVMTAGEGLPPVMADPAQLEQVVVNLASNARDDFLVCRYSPPGNVVGERTY